MVLTVDDKRGPELRAIELVIATGGVVDIGGWGRPTSANFVDDRRAKLGKRRVQAILLAVGLVN